jgi:hypothetical protein
MTSAAIRSLERARRLRGKSLLEDSRGKVVEQPITDIQPLLENGHQPQVSADGGSNGHRSVVDQTEQNGYSQAVNMSTNRRRRKAKDTEQQFADRKPISEVLHDIYDDNTH